MEQIRFSTNWNNKLECLHYSTMRIGSFKYHVGKDYDIVLQKEHLHIAQIKEIRIRMLWEFDDIDFYLDTGYNKEDSIKMFLEMYPKNDFSKDRIFMILLKRLDIYKKLTTPIE